MIISRASQNSTHIICQLLNLDKIPPPEEVTKESAQAFLDLAKEQGKVIEND